MSGDVGGESGGIRPGATSAVDFLGIDSLLSEEELLLRDTVRRFVADRVLPHIGDWFEQGVFPVASLAPELGGLGLLGMHLEGYGCAGSSATAYGLACAELEAGDSGVRSFMSVQGSLAMFPIRAFGSEEQRRQWLPPMATGEAVGCFGLTEPDAGSDPAAMRTRARRDGPDWILNGTKMWITNGSIADVAVVWAQTDEPDGSGEAGGGGRDGEAGDDDRGGGGAGGGTPEGDRGGRGAVRGGDQRDDHGQGDGRAAGGGKRGGVGQGGVERVGNRNSGGGRGRGVRGFVVPTDTAGFSAHDISRKLSLRASVTSELVLEDVRLPADAVLPGVVGMRGPLSCLNEARFGIVFGAVGAARACYEAALAYAAERNAFGGPISRFQLTQQKLVEMMIAVQRGTLLALHLGRLRDAGRLSAAQISVGKLDNVRMALEVARTARSVLGANGITLDYPVVRHMNNLESVFTYEGTHEIHTLIIGQALTGHPAFT